MKRFVKNIVLFLLPLVLLPAFLELMIYMKGDSILSERNLENSFKASRCDYQWVQKISHPKKILLLGSSTIKYSLSCSILNKLAADSLSFINLADNARDPVATYFILSGLDLNNVKSMYMGLDPWIYTKAYYKSRPDIFYTDLSIRQSVHYFQEHDGDVFFKRWKNSIKYLFDRSGTVHCSSAGKEVPPDFGSLVLDKRPQNFGGAIQSRFQLEEYGWSDLQFYYLKKIAGLCREKNISFSFLIPPKRSDFCKAYETGCVDIHKDFLNKLAALQIDVPVIGKFDQLTSLGDSTLFSDAYHLNGEGQQVYSKLFFEMMNSRNLSHFSTSYSWFDR